MKIKVNHDEARLISQLLRIEWDECNELLESSPHLEMPMPAAVYRALHSRKSKVWELAERFLTTGNDL